MTPSFTKIWTLTKEKALHLNYQITNKAKEMMNSVNCDIFISFRPTVKQSKHLSESVILSDNSENKYMSYRNSNTTKKTQEKQMSTPVKLIKYEPSNQNSMALCDIEVL